MTTLTELIDAQAAELVAKSREILRLQSCVESLRRSLAQWIAECQDVINPVFTEENPCCASDEKSASVSESEMKYTSQ